MTDATTQGSADGRSAGTLLREARQAQGLHIVALASAIKVTPGKLEALEADRYDELPDAAFTRALARTVCRVLKIDAEAVMARLPHLPGKELDRPGKLNVPFRERDARRDGREGRRLSRPVVWGSLVLVIAALVVYLLPASLWTRLHGEAGEAAMPAANAPATPAAVATPGAATTEGSTTTTPGVVTETLTPAVPAPASAPATVAAVPAATGALNAAQPAAAAASATLQVEASGQSWIEVRDAANALLLSRTLKPSESVTVDAVPPLRVTVGNVAGTHLRFRGQPVALQSRDNTARVELK